MIKLGSLIYFWFFQIKILHFFSLVFTSILIEFTSSQDGIYFSRESILSGANIQVNDGYDRRQNVHQNKLSRNLINNSGRLLQIQAVDSNQYKKFEDFPNYNRRQDFEFSDTREGNPIKGMLPLK
jgi:hypothetical protein